MYSDWGGKTQENKATCHGSLFISSNWKWTKRRAQGGQKKRPTIYTIDLLHTVALQFLLQCASYFCNSTFSKKKKLRTLQKSTLEREICIIGQKREIWSRISNSRAVILIWEQFHSPYRTLPMPGDSFGCVTLRKLPLASGLEAKKLWNSLQYRDNLHQNNNP